MHNFVFHNPTKVLFGRGTLQALGTETAAWGTKALLVYGQASCKKSGLYDQVRAQLAGAGLIVTDFGGVAANPLLSKAREGIELARSTDCEVIVAVGGGSVLDTAKAIGAGALVAHDVWKFFTGKKGVKGSLPVLTVPTMAASGSELNSGMVLTNEATREKFGFGHRLLFPKVSILDPENTFTVPRDYTAYGAVDAFSHVLEFYLSTKEPGTFLQDRLMESLMATSMDACVRALVDPRDYDARADLLWSASLALGGVTAAGLGRVEFPMHLIEHSLSALYNVPHGAGLAVVMLGWLREHQESHTARIAQLGRRLFMVQATDDQAAARESISHLAQWLHSTQVPTSLTALGINAAAIPAISANTRGLARIWRLSAYTPERVTAILERCLI